MTTGPVLFLFCALACMNLRAQPGTPTLPRFYGCGFPAPDSVDMTGDGIMDLLVSGMLGESTCDIPVSYGGCHVVVRTLPGTLMLGRVGTANSSEAHGFARGDTILALGVVSDDMRIQRFGFIDGFVTALDWSYGRNGVASAQPSRIADGTFIYSTSLGERISYGSFSLKSDLANRTVRIVAGPSPQVDEPFVVR
ncbi:MAG: hypothetical protein IPJ85_13570 [Flavobacteriales bacterium]|nr:hypothetical protein [Flavobacteriales bacterium]